MKRKDCQHIYRFYAKYFSGICAAGAVILAAAIVALIIPKNIFTFGEIWGIVVHRYQVIVFSGIIVCYPAYRAAEFCFCRRCPDPPKKAEEQCGFMLII